MAGEGEEILDGRLPSNHNANLRKHQFTAPFQIYFFLQRYGKDRGL
jgi:hypothetical protein